jgi:hypothetical protein
VGEAVRVADDEGLEGVAGVDVDVGVAAVAARLRRACGQGSTAPQAADGGGVVGQQLGCRVGADFEADRQRSVDGLGHGLTEQVHVAVLQTLPDQGARDGQVKVGVVHGDRDHAFEPRPPGGVGQLGFQRGGAHLPDPLCVRYQRCTPLSLLRPQRNPQPVDSWPFPAPFRNLLRARGKRRADRIWRIGNRGSGTVAPAPTGPHTARWRSAGARPGLPRGGGLPRSPAPSTLAPGLLGPLSPRASGDFHAGRATPWPGGDG